MASRNKSKESFAIVNKNFMNYPLARDRREQRWQWCKSSKSGRWIGRLPDDDRISYRLPANAKARLRRCPTPFDVNVLLLVFVETRKQGRNKAEFASYSEMLRALGFGIDQNNIRRLREALELWSKLTVVFADFYEKSAPFKKPTKGKRALPPPIVTVDKSKEIQIEVSLDWIAISQRYFARVPLPLPREAAAQCLVLLLLAFYSLPGELGEAVTFNRRIRQLHHKLGLEHSDRNLSLQRALDTAREWFATQSTELSWRWLKNNKIGFALRRSLKIKGAQPKSNEKPKREWTDEKHDALDRAEAEREAQEEARLEAEEAQFEADMDKAGIDLEDAEDAQIKFRMWRKEKGLPL